MQKRIWTSLVGLSLALAPAIASAQEHAAAAGGGEGFMKFFAIAIGAGRAEKRRLVGRLDGDPGVLGAHHDGHLRPGDRLSFRGVAGEPDVLADRQPDPRHADPAGHDAEESGDVSAIQRCW